MDWARGVYRLRGVGEAENWNVFEGKNSLLLPQVEVEYFSQYQFKFQAENDGDLRFNSVTFELDVDDGFFKIAKSS